MAVPDKGTAYVQVHVKDAAGVTSPTSCLSGVKSSCALWNGIGVLVLGLVTGGSAGVCMGAMSAEIIHFLNNAAQGQTELAIKIPQLCPFISSSYVTYLSLLGLISVSAAGVGCGVLVYEVVQKQRWGDSSAGSVALAANVAVLGVAVAGSAVGASLEWSLSHFLLTAFSVDSSVIFILCHTVVTVIIASVLCATAGLFYGYIAVTISLLIDLLIFSERLLSMLFFKTEAIIFLDLGTLLPLILPSLLLCLLHKFQLSKTVVNIPTLMIITLLISRSLLHDEHQPVPMLDPTEFTTPTLLVLERFFVIVFGIQVFQASCGAMLHSYFSTDETNIVYAVALAATFGVVATLPQISPMLGTGALFGSLLAASGGAGVALNAAGNLGQRYGGHVGRAGAVIGAAVCAFLPLATQDFGIMVALCAAVIPGSAFVEVCLDFINRRHLFCRIVLMSCLSVFLVVGTFSSPHAYSSSVGYNLSLSVIKSSM
ncbi:uncharacterized protein [Hoplias malabaricus]|uniref:uncharacterized protein isoform X2 n=1 Tax=Hoplias malabaricus TaxID=27720 RepID=UPI003462743E